jgi:cephalosporin hydroxylase
MEIRLTSEQTLSNSLIIKSFRGGLFLETIKTSFFRKMRAPVDGWFAQKALKNYHSIKRTTPEIVKFSMKFPSSGCYRIDSIQIESELSSLIELVKAQSTKVILEIGTARGGTLFAWSQLASELVVSCDLNGPGYKETFYTKLPPPESKCQVVTLQGNSHNPLFKASVKAKLQGQLVDFLFLDGDHTEKGVEQDFNDYIEFVRPGGYVAFHDIVENQPYPTNQVYYFWSRLKNNFEFMEYINNPQQCGFGIGVIKIPTAQQK